MKQLEVDEVEMACIKALVFFDPRELNLFSLLFFNKLTISPLNVDAKGLGDTQRVGNIRRQILINLEDYVFDEHMYKARGRVGEILLILPLLQSIAVQLVEQIQFAKLLGVAHIDDLLQEMLLDDSNEPILPDETLSRMICDIGSWSMDLNDSGHEGSDPIYLGAVSNGIMSSNPGDINLIQMGNGTGNSLIGDIITSFKTEP